jgi:N-acetylglucosamine-6-phosphate deacetylase
MTQSKENITNALSAVKEFIASDAKDGAKLLGVHLEGPFISEKHVGAQPEEFLAVPDCEVFDNYYKASGDSIKIVSLAPEKQGADELISHLKSLGVRASAGHTDATFDQIEKALTLGLSSITHTYNAQKGVHHREVGTVGAGMLLDQLYTEAICDLIHLSVPAIKLLLKNKPKDKFILITDSMRAKHLPDGISELGGQKVIVKGGEARLENGALAGSVLKMNDAVKNLVKHCGVKLEDAINFATINPATHLGVSDKIGSIKEGKIADFVVLDEDFSVTTTVVDGKVVYHN